jgi:hypothetical protein
MGTSNLPAHYRGGVDRREVVRQDRAARTEAVVACVWTDARAVVHDHRASVKAVSTMRDASTCMAVADELAIMAGGSALKARIAGAFVDELVSFAIADGRRI